jgi:hypothetical protein
VSQVCSGRASVANHQNWSEQIGIIPQSNNIKNSVRKIYEVSGIVVEPFSSSGTVAEARATSKCHIAEYQVCLDYAIPDSIKKDNDLMMSCPDRVCSQCGNDHSFRGNFEDVITSIDIIPTLLNTRRNDSLTSMEVV